MITSAHHKQAKELLQAHPVMAETRAPFPGREKGGERTCVPAVEAERYSGAVAANRYRSRLPGIWAIALPLLVLLFGAVPASGDTPVTLYQSFAGNINITGTGGTLRTAADPTSCTVVNNGSMTLSGIPAGATVMRAYLYWAGSGGDPVGGAGTDYTVTFNGTAVTADRSYTASYNGGGGNVVYFFGGVKEVTAQVSGNGAYTFSNLTVQTANVGGGGQYCTSQAVLSAFSLMVVYSDPAEILHVVNIWEGFQGYRGAAITLTPTNFTVPSPAPVTPLSSRILILTWEGDNGNSAALGGFTENLTFCSPTPCAGVALTDVYNPANNQFNSTVDMPPSGPFSGINTSWGNDLDMYDITTMVPAAAASAQSVYSSGGDLVILMNQTMAIPNVPVADLAITKSHAGNFTVGVNGVYTLSVTNNGPSDATGTITVTDTLPAGLTYVSAVGTGWTCGAVGQTVTCTRPGPLVNGASAPSITLTVSVGAAAFPGVTNTVSATSGAFDNIAANSTNVGDPTAVLAPDLSTSTKTWVDLNGGDANPGDTLRYTITLIETGGAAAANVSVTDDMPANVTGFTVVNAGGGTNNSTGAGTGANGTGYLNITNISIPATGSVTVVFDVIVAGGTPVGTLIDNCATITNPGGTGAAPCASTITVSGSSIPASGNKPLYLYQTPIQMTRTPNTQTTAITLAVGGGTQMWPLSPVLQLNSTLSPAVNSTVPVYLVLRRGTANGNRSITVNLQCSSGGTTLTQTQTVALTNTRTLYTFNLPLGANLMCLAGNTWNLRVTNNSGADSVRFYPYDAGPPVIRSYAFLPTTTVINVDSVALYDAAYPGGSVAASVAPGATVFVRSVISDPFGSFDITGATATITDSLGAVQVNAAAMTQVADSGAATKTYEYTYVVPGGGPAGSWTVRVDGAEGTEGSVSDYAQTALTVVVPMPNLLMLKSVSTVSDPVNGAVNPKAIPGATMLYTILVTNSGPGAADNNTLVITDPVPANTTMYVDTGPGDPVTFSCSAVPPCGLTFNYGANVRYTDTFPLPALLAPPNVCGNFTYVPVGSFDANVRGVCINPAGVLNGSSGAPYPQFTLQFRVMVN
jgi:uncharacterized repeat protein (TIGR01451 family)